MRFSDGSHEPLQSPPPLGSDNEYLVTQVLGRPASDLPRLVAERVIY
jgi:hypothetical protein